MNRVEFLSFLDNKVKAQYPVYKYLKYPLEKINTSGSPENIMPIISESMKFILGERTGFWYCFPFNSSTHAVEKGKRVVQDFWIEGENHVFSKYRYIFLRNGGSYDLVLYLLARNIKLVQEFWDVGVAIKTQNHKIVFGEYSFDVYPTVGNLFLISLLNPTMYPELDIQWDSSVADNNVINKYISDNTASIILT